MSSILQQSASAAIFGASLTSTPTLPGNRTVGSTIVVLASHEAFTGGTPGLSVNDGTSFGLAQQKQQSTFMLAGIYSRQNVAGGVNPSIVVTADAGLASNSFGYTYAYEVATVQNIGFDANGILSAGANSNAPATGSTPTLSAAGSMIFAAFAGDNSFAGATLTTLTGAGWTVDFSDFTNGSQNPTVFAHKHVASNASVSAAIGTLTTATTWAAVMATLEDTTAAVGGRGLLLTGVG